jgi:hypothetical protein
LVVSTTAPTQPAKQPLPPPQPTPCPRWRELRQARPRRRRPRLRTSRSPSWSAGRQGPPRTPLLTRDSIGASPTRPPIDTLGHCHLAVQAGRRRGASGRHHRPGHRQSAASNRTTDDGTGPATPDRLRPGLSQRLPSSTTAGSGLRRHRPPSKSIISTATHIAWTLTAMALAAIAGDDHAPATTLWPAPMAGQPEGRGTAPGPAARWPARGCPGRWRCG